MLLYAIVRSERASKGQGGNERLDTIYTIGKARREFMRVQMTAKGESVLVQVREEGRDRVREWEVMTEGKGKKQKGECRHDIVKDDYGQEYCQECGKYNVLT